MRCLAKAGHMWYLFNPVGAGWEVQRVTTWMASVFNFIYVAQVIALSWDTLCRVGVLILLLIIYIGKEKL